MASRIKLHFFFLHKSASPSISEVIKRCWRSVLSQKVSLLAIQYTVWFKVPFYNILPNTWEIQSMTTFLWTPNLKSSYAKYSHFETSFG